MRPFSSFLMLHSEADHSSSSLHSYLLSSHPPPLDSLSPPTAPSRVQLYGAASPSTSNGTIDIDGILLTEVLEYALSLVPVLKGQEPFAGIPSLQAYKLWHAMTLIETGENALAQRSVQSSLASIDRQADSHCLQVLRGRRLFPQDEPRWRLPLSHAPLPQST